MLLTSFIFVLLVQSFVGASSNTNSVREQCLFDVETKWNCFYRTTTPVKGLDPAIWRHDQYGNLLMAGLNYNCQGCLCYTFDHRCPISILKYLHEKTPLLAKSLTDLVTSIDNCQALSFRTNALKGSSEDHEIQSVMGKFGCDKKTMRLFTDKDYFGARVVQKQLLSEERIETLHQYYKRYINSEDFIDPALAKGSKTKYFGVINSMADGVARMIRTKLNALMI